MTIPFLDEPAFADAFTAQTMPPTARVEGAVPICTGAQLSALVDGWTPKDGGGSGGARDPGQGLVAFVKLTNNGPRCRLAELPNVTVGRNLPAAVVSTGAEADVDLLNGSAAEVRLDWAAPFCGDVGDPSSIDLEVGGKVVPARAPLALRPTCSRGPASDRGDALVATPYTPWTRGELDSTFSAVTVAVEAPSGPVVAGEEFAFVVALTNPTGAPIRFDNRPGYAIGMVGTDLGGGEFLTETIGYLNYRALDALGPGTTRFEMRARTPDGLWPGSSIDVTWRLLARGLDSDHRATFTVPAA